jgi:hypothetical protein
MRERGAKGARTALAAMAAALLAGCASGLSGIMASGPLPYQHANAIMTSGFAETQIAPDHYRIEVTGYPNTSRQRLEKIAATRAAEIGRDNRLGYFKINGLEHTSRCQKFISGAQKSGAGTAERHVALIVLTADVSYAKTPPDPAYVEAKTAYDQYKAELDADTAPPPPLDPAAAQCS